MNEFGFEEIFSSGDTLLERLNLEEQSQLRGGASMLGCGNGLNGCAKGTGCKSGGSCSNGENGPSGPPTVPPIPGTMTVW